MLETSYFILGCRTPQLIHSTVSMAEAPDTGDRVTPIVHSSTAILVPPTLEELAEEEDVFLPEMVSPCPVFKTGEVKGKVSTRLEGAGAAEQLENDFLHLTIRKQVSYR